MMVTVSGLSGLTNAYTSVLSATGSLEISGASRCDDIDLPHRLEWADGRAHLTVRAIRAARSLSRSRVWLVPENTSISPDFALRTCTTIGPDGAVTSPPLRDNGWLVAPRAEPAAAPMAVAARPAAPAVAAPWRTERRDRPRLGGSGDEEAARRPDSAEAPAPSAGACRAS